MLSKSDLKVIRGGALETSTRPPKFIKAYTTDTRLMGVIVIYIHWEMTHSSILDNSDEKSLHQFFYIETSEDGIETYKSVKGDKFDEIDAIAYTMLGGLGADKVELSEKDAVFLVQQSASINKEYGLLLPEGYGEYSFILDEAIELTTAEELELFNRICGKITNDRQLINYFLMRYYARDFYPVDMFSSVPIDHNLLSIKGSSTLCLNKIDAGVKEGDITSYLNESVIEDEVGYRIVISEIRTENEKVISLEIVTEFAISTAEAAMKLARPEFVSVYELAGQIDNIEEYLDTIYIKAQQSITEGGKLYVSFASDNNHVNCDVYRLNDDVEEIVYLTVEDQLVIGAYSLERIKMLEDKLRVSEIGMQLFDIGKYEFKEPVLYDYTLGVGNDFIGYVEDIIGVEEDDDDE